MTHTRDKEIHDTYVGRDAVARRSTLSMRSPVVRGVITHWDDMEMLWRHMYRDELKVKADQHPVLINVASTSTAQERSRIAQSMFETFNVPLLYIADQAVLSLSGTVRTSGLVLESGAGVSYVVPVHEGRVLQHAVQSIEVAGDMVDHHLDKKLKERGYDLQDLSLVRAVKEKLGYKNHICYQMVK
eukprot:gene8384-9856_t